MQKNDIEKCLTYLGKMVKVIVDRPLGSFHPRSKNIFYTVNYGYLPGILAPDGAEQDAYILGVETPVKEYDGFVCAIIHRFNDVENKLVVCPKDWDYSKEKIQQQVWFVEQFFESEIILCSKTRKNDK